MKKTILSVVLVFSMVSCASLMDFDGVYRSDGSAVVDPNPYDPMTGLLLGLYVSSLIINPSHRSRYYYPLIIPPYRAYGGPNGLPTWEDILYESLREADLQNYKRELERIKEDLIYDLKHEIERAKEKD